MAWFIDRQHVLTAEGTEPVWRTDYAPGDIVPLSGIYRCQACRKEVTSNAGDPFPPQNHHQHPQAGAVRWRLLVWTNTTGS
jgi:hypothetical protein